MNITYTNQQQLVAAALVFLGAVCFSAKAVLVKLAYQYEIDSLSLLALRMLFSLPFFLLVAFLFRKPTANAKQQQPISKKDWGAIISLGIVGYYLASYFDFIGLQYITASLERLILFIYPTLVVLISAILYRKKITKEQWIALLLTYIGIGCAFSDSTALIENENIWLGASLVFISALTYAIYLIGSGQLLPRIGTARYTSYVMTVACVAVLLHYIISSPFTLFDFPLPVYGLALLMAVLSTVTPAFLVSEGIRIIGSSNASIIGSVGPISTIILAYIFLGERIGSWQIFGTFLVIGGVSIIALQKKKRLNNMKYHLAQLNIALAIAPLDTPVMEGFTSKLDQINVLAESSVGFVWRLQDESGDATAIQAFPDPLMIVNMSVWESLDALKEYVFHTDHVAMMRQRKKWFQPLKEASMVFWWIPVGHKPTVEEAKERLELLRKKGASAKAFNFKTIFSPPE